MSKLLKDDIAALKQARRAIETGKSMFVCTALSHHATNKAAVKRLHKDINQQLEGCILLSTWIIFKYPKLQREIERDTRQLGGGPRMRVTRLAWIDSMIAERVAQL